MKSAIAGWVVATVLVLSGADRARAQEVSLFGQPGQVVLDADVRASFEYTNTTPPGGGDGASTTDVVLRPGLLYFVVPNVAIGASLGFESRETEGQSSTAFGAGPTLAFNVPLGPRVSMLPQLGLAYSHVTLEIGTQEVSGYVLAGGVGVPFLFHLAPHFFLGFGPSVAHTFVSRVEGQDGSTQLRFGLLAMFGGWL